MAGCMDKYIFYNYVLVRSMLEAIIAFMPIKEDHEAIGAVDYPTEVRKAFAKNSVNFKCEECGLVSKLLHEKKKKEEVISTTKTEKEKENPITTNEQSNTSKKEKEKKVNFQEYFKQLHENEKKPKEEIDCVEEEEIHITSFPEKKEKVFIGLNSSRDFDRESSFTPKKEEPLINTSHNLETLESKITEIKKEEETIPQKKENKEIKEEKVNDIKVEKDEDKENKDSSDESTFDGFFNEDIEFNFVRKSIKCHFDQSKEDIEKQVKLDENLKKITMQPVQQHIPESIKEKVPSKATTEDTIKNEKDIKVLKELLNKEKTIIKYYSRIQYQKTQGESLKKFNTVMGIIIASVTLIYILIRLIMKN